MSDMSKKDFKFLEDMPQTDSWIDTIEAELFTHRKIFLFKEIDEDSARDTVLKFLLLDKINHKPILLYIDSPGGNIHDGMAIHDIIQHIKSPVSTICVGEASSMASLILTCGTKGIRKTYPYARIMIHEMWEQTSRERKASEMRVDAKEIETNEEIYISLLSKYAGQSIETVKKDILKTTFMSAEEAWSYGIIDEIIK